MNQIKEIAVMQSENELNIGEKALKSGNIGKARVCARRACMFAINYWLHKNQNYNWGKTAINFLENVRDENALPENVRFSAKRLTERVDKNFATSNSENPLEDAKIIINYFFS
jgi:hypothetical protein